MSEQIEFLKRQFKIDNKNKENNKTKILQAKEHASIEYDPKGFFVIQTNLKTKEIQAEHYENVLDGGAMLTGKLNSIIKGKTATALYQTIIKNEKISVPEHIAYIGRELHKAELSIKLGLQYTQDKPLEMFENK